MSGVHPMALSAIETGKLKGFSLYDLDRARKAMELSLSYVMDGEGNAMREERDKKEESEQ
jgi:hypothetical protein